MKNGVAFLLISLFIICTGCNQEGTNEKVDYEETKKMVVDILKTDDGKKALQEVLKDESMKNEIIMNDDTVKKAIESTLTSDKEKSFGRRHLKIMNLQKLMPKLYDLNIKKS